MADHAITDNCDSDFAHNCLNFFSITAYLNDSAVVIIDANQMRLYIPINGYIIDFDVFL